MVRGGLCGALAITIGCRPVDRSVGAEPVPRSIPVGSDGRGVVRVAVPVDTAPRQFAAASDDDLARTVVAVFGDSAALHPSAAAAPDLEPVWDIDVHSYETHDRVAFYVQLFSTSSRERFRERLSRGTRYEPMIRAKLRASGMPEDLTYLALIESGYDPHAYSRAAAVGLWQFMSSTARDVGLRVDWWVDQRRDPVRSTDAAVRFLNYLRQQFGSLYLAAAAYNGGPGRVARGLSRYADDLEGTSGDSLFFALAETDALRRETKDYVPQLVAAALVGKEPARYGLKLDSLPSFAYDSALVPAATPLAAVAKAAGVELAAITELNPGILRGATPPDVSWMLRVPPGTGAGIPAALALLDEGDRRAWSTVTTKKGQTMASVARAHGITAQQLAWYNPKVQRRKKTGALAVGQLLRVPTAATVAAAREVPDPSLEIYGRSSRSRGRTVTHVVREGETLSSIATKYGTTVKALQQRNRLRKPMVVAGQRLVIRSGSGGGRASAKTSRAAPRSSPKQGAPTKKP